MMTLFSGQSGPIAHVSRILGAAAQVSEAAGDAASSVVSRGTEITSAVSSAVLDITSTSYGALQTAWHGVDLVNLSIHKVSGTVTAASPMTIASWLNSSNGRNLTTASDADTHDIWRRMLQDVSSSMPHLSRIQERLSLQGSFLWVNGEVHWSAGGQALFFYEVTKVKFEPRWANPMWAALELSHEAEHQQVLQILQQVLREAPRPNRTMTQLGQDASGPALVRMLLHRAWQGMRTGDWSALENHGNLWGSGLVFLGWLCTKMIGGPALHTEVQANVEPVGRRQQDNGEDPSVSSISSASSGNSTGLFEVVGSIQ
jgi:hypothetical protein